MEAFQGRRSAQVQADQFVPRCRRARYAGPSTTRFTCGQAGGSVLIAVTAQVGHGVVAGRDGDGHRSPTATAPEILVEPPRPAQQAAGQHDRERLGHRRISLMVLTRPWWLAASVGCRTPADNPAAQTHRTARRHDPAHTPAAARKLSHDSARWHPTCAGGTRLRRFSPPSTKRSARGGWPPGHGRHPRPNPERPRSPGRSPRRRPHQVDCGHPSRRGPRR